MPAASSVLSPFAAIAFLTVLELFGPLPNLRNALEMGSQREVSRLLLGAVLGLPLGLALLSSVSPTVFNWTVSLVVLGLLIALLKGWRYEGRLRPRAVTGIGGLGGFMAGISGLPGPPVILFYMASRNAIATIRANFLLYLLGIDVIMIVSFLVLDALNWTAVILAILMILPYMAANAGGALLFRAEAEGHYRAVAYTIIAASALFGLPVWT